jgi:hypothetical protein
MILPAGDVLQELGTSPQGLGHAEAQTHLHGIASVVRLFLSIQALNVARF